ncbi:hypothetical protein FOWG_17101 [Fusarium oxysporum f. sp. lycopersici MN25]|nr:hypothetical protein FOWG_17101 [Fusarium oxysporum f. sp. lycopersici MN25]
MAVQRTSQNLINTLSKFDFLHIYWKYSGDIDNEPLHLLLKWAKDSTAWRTVLDDDTTIESHKSKATDEEEMLDYISMRMLKQYSDMNQHSPVSTLHFAARLVEETRQYLEDAHLKMHNLNVYQEGDYHRWAASAMSEWAGGIEDCLISTEMYENRLRRKETRPRQNSFWYKPIPSLDPPSERWENLRQLRDGLAKLSSLLTHETLTPQLIDIERMARTGRMWAPKMVDLYSPTTTRRSDGLIKLMDEGGYAADLFVPANTDFRNDAEMRNRIGSFTQVQWSVRNLSDGSRQVMPDLESVAMPISVWRTIARVAAVLQPRTGRQLEIKGILERSGWPSDGHWLELEMEAFFSAHPRADPARKLTEEVRLRDGERDLDTRIQESPGQGPSQLEVEEVTDEEASALVLRWQKEQQTDGKSSC